MQGTDSSSDSDISSDSDEDHPPVSTAAQRHSPASASSKETAAQAVQPCKPCTSARPTPVRHAAATTIQRWYKQLKKYQHPDTVMPQCIVTSSQTSFHGSDIEASRQQAQHAAACCIQKWWRKHLAKRRGSHAPPVAAECSPAVASCSTSICSVQDLSGSQQTGNTNVVRCSCGQ